jgi:hypothetical protein
MSDLQVLEQAVLSARRRFEDLSARYNAEYRAGLWDTNRGLASKIESAYDAVIAADQALSHAAAMTVIGGVTS